MLKYIDISLNYTHYNHFDRLNSNGSLGRGVGQVGVRLAYGFNYKKILEKKMR
jgi:hypothetical protein